MDLNDISLTSARFPFKSVKGKRGIKFKQVIERQGSGTSLEIEHNGHDHIVFDFRSISTDEKGKKSNKRTMYWPLETKSAVQLASLLIYLADEHMRDDTENPYTVVVSADKTGFGGNWVYEDLQTAQHRIELRKKRSHLLGLMQRCLETCEDEGFVEFLAFNIAMWAESSGDGFAAQKAEKALSQLNMLCKEMFN